MASMGHLEHSAPCSAEAVRWKPDAGRVENADLITAMIKGADTSVSDEEMTQIEQCACPGRGSCSGMFTANSMNSLTEAIGLSLPGGAVDSVVAPALTLAIRFSQRCRQNHNVLLKVNRETR